MQKFLLIIFLLLIISLPVAAKQKADLILSAAPISSSTTKLERYFEQNRKIYWIIMPKKKFKDSVIRIQIMKKSDKVPYYGYSIAFTRDIPIDMDKKYHTDYFTLQENGYYIVRIFEIRDLETPIATSDLWIK